MNATAKTARRLNHAADRLPGAMLLCGELRRAILEGRPLNRLLLIMDELAEQLYTVEHHTGSVTPSMFGEMQ